jgi:excinuclease UvrABC nuclease subunit
MRLTIEWKRPLQLTDASADGLIYSFESKTVEAEAGLYVFGRMHGHSFEAFYVGRANNLQNRTKGQLKNLKLMLHLQKAKTGKRVIITGVFKPRKGQQVDRCLPILERALIRHFLSDGHDLVNVQGTRIRRHEIASSGSKQMPELMFVDRGKGE